jgi:hypothetical protein
LGFICPDGVVVVVVVADELSSMMQLASSGEVVALVEVGPRGPLNSTRSILALCSLQVRPDTEER